MEMGQYAITLPARLSRAFAGDQPAAYEVGRELQRRVESGDATVTIDGQEYHVEAAGGYQVERLGPERRAPYDAGDIVLIADERDAEPGTRHLYQITGVREGEEGYRVYLRRYADVGAGVLVDAHEVDRRLTPEERALLVAAERRALVHLLITAAGRRPAVVAHQYLVGFSRGNTPICLVHDADGGVVTGERLDALLAELARAGVERPGGKFIVHAGAALLHGLSGMTFKQFDAGLLDAMRRRVGDVYEQLCLPRAARHTDATGA